MDQDGIPTELSFDEDRDTATIIIVTLIIGILMMAGGIFYLAHQLDVAQSQHYLPCILLK